jgi:hypothetical protein
MAKTPAERLATFFRQKTEDYSSANLTAEKCRHCRIQKRSTVESSNVQKIFFLFAACLFH